MPAAQTTVLDRLNAAVILLRSWGYTVKGVKGWRTRRARSDIAFAPAGVIVHHTGDNNTKQSLLVNGRTGIPGPLCNVEVQRTGVITMIAAGYANHAGINDKQAVEKVLAGGAAATISPGADTAGYSANRRTFGIEAQGGKGWTATQHKSVVAVCAALAIVSGWSKTKPPVGAHKEITRRKPVDPYGVDMGAFRREVAALIKAKTTPAPAPSGTLKLRPATINVKSADPAIDAGGAKTWPARAGDLTAAIKAADAGVVCVQEATAAQLAAILAALPGGTGRWAAVSRRAQHVVYDTTRFTASGKTDILVNVDGYHGAVAVKLTDKTTGISFVVCSAHIAPPSLATAATQKTQLGKVIAAVDKLADGGVRIIGVDANNVSAPAWASPYWDANDTAAEAGVYRGAPTRDTRRIDLLLYRMGGQHTITAAGYGQRDTKTGSDHALVVASLRVSRKTTVPTT